MPKETLKLPYLTQHSKEETMGKLVTRMTQQCLIKKIILWILRK